MGEKPQTTSCLKVHNRFALQNSGIPLKRVYTKVIKRNVKFKSVDFDNFLFLCGGGGFNMGINGKL